MGSGKRPERGRDRRFFLGVDARQLAAAYFLVATLIVIAALLGRELSLVNITILSVMVLAAMGLGLWYLIFYGLRRAASGELDLVAEFVSSSPEGRLMTTKDGEFIMANDSYFDVLRLDKRQRGQTLLEVMNNNIAAREQLKALSNAAKRGDKIDMRVEIKTSDGRWLSILAHTIKAIPDCIIWYVAETTVQHKIEEVERSEREKLSEYFNNAPVGFYSLDSRGRVQFVNRIFAEWLGYHQRELAEGNIAFSDLVIKGDDRQLSLMDSMGEDSHRYEGEVQLCRRDGTILPVHVTQTIVHDENGEVIGSRSVVRELLQEQLWRERVESAEQHFRRFFEAAPIGIVLLDANGIVVEGNPAFRVLTETVVDSAIGQHVSQLVIEADRPELNEKLARASASDLSPTPVEMKLIGGERIANFYISAVEGPDGSADSMLIHIIDTSAQRQLEVQFAQSQKMQAVGQLAGGIAHDFNNLLTAMIGFCDLLLLRHQVGDQSYSDISQIKQNANRAAGLVRQLLAFSRQQTLRPKVTDLTEVLAELSNLLRRLIGETIELEIKHARDLWLVKVDQSQFEQVIINLAVNARDAMSGNGRLSFRTENYVVRTRGVDAHELVPEGEYIRLLVTDTGTGIPDEVIAKVFDPFFTTKKVGEGTGLGLSTVYGIIKQTGGFIFVKNNEDRGTTFEIFLPKFSEVEQIADSTGAEPQRVHKDLSGIGTVLLVEDEDPVRMFAARALQNKGYEVLQADCGETALDVVSKYEGTIDLLITDVVMPNMDGPTLVKNITKDKPDLRVIFISGYAEDAFRRDLDFDIDKIEFLPKPFSLKEIAEKVKEVMSTEVA
ncbi:hybrid sensor histidine kinase/response regulator [Sneathiella glossodoripedis]|uniref:hybrid sensor histidine kinase/response regulator n=1 Tax=Sneathiella glossodoripedis TaxID=418853 RepID=UPI000688967C|nr:PAS domain-containing sensor histidine kinase [Sneathiella glossodoripedis]